MLRARTAVAFSTRVGGVSDGPFESLNLGIRTEDDPARVVENRRASCDAVGADPDGATMAWQRHGATVSRAQPRGIVTPGTVYDHCDGLWTDEPGRAMLLLTADCLPIALARADGAPPAVAVLHAGWRGLLAGIVAAGVARARRRRARRRDRPGHRPVLLRGRGRGRGAVPRARSATTSSATAGSTSGRAAERALRAAGVRARRPLRPLHVLRPGAVLLAPARRTAAPAARG